MGCTQTRPLSGTPQAATSSCSASSSSAVAGEEELRQLRQQRERSLEVMRRLESALARTGMKIEPGIGNDSFRLPPQQAAAGRGHPQLHALAQPPQPPLSPSARPSQLYRQMTSYGLSLLALADDPEHQNWRNSADPYAVLASSHANPALNPGLGRRRSTNSDFKLEEHARARARSKAHSRTSSASLNEVGTGSARRRASSDTGELLPPTQLARCPSLAQVKNDLLVSSASWRVAQTARLAAERRQKPQPPSQPPSQQQQQTSQQPPPSQQQQQQQQQQRPPRSSLDGMCDQLLDDDSMSEGTSDDDGGAGSGGRYDITPGTSSQRPSGAPPAAAGDSGSPGAGSSDAGSPEAATRLLLHRENASQFMHSVVISAFRTSHAITFDKPWGRCVARPGDYVVHGAGGDGVSDLVPMAAETFHEAYRPVEAAAAAAEEVIGAAVPSPTRFRPRSVVLARRMSCVFEATPTKRLVRTPELAGREAGSLPHQDGGTSGTPGMYLVQDSMGQQWACSAERFRTTYSTCGNTEWLLSVLSGVDSLSRSGSCGSGLRRVRSASAAPHRTRSPQQSNASPRRVSDNSKDEVLAMAGSGRSRASSMPEAWSEGGGGRDVIYGVEVDAHEWAQQLRAVLARADDWRFDVFALAQATDGRPLLHAGLHLFSRHGLLSGSSLVASAPPSPAGAAGAGAAGAGAGAPAVCVAEETLALFLSAVERTYLPNPYHNSSHATDVMLSAHQLLLASGFGAALAPAELLAVLLAAAVHDVGHPGTSNAFQINSCAEVALRYNDVSVLENFHCATAFQIMRGAVGGGRANVLEVLPVATRNETRKLMVQLVMATDLAKHNALLQEFQAHCEGGGLTPAAVLRGGEDAAAARSVLLSLTMKCADLSHPAKDAETHLRWTGLMMQEFADQLDKERALGLPISMAVESDAAGVASSQVGFLKFIIEPLYAAYCGFWRQGEEEEEAASREGGARGKGAAEGGENGAAVAAPAPPPVTKLDFDANVAQNIAMWRADGTSEDHPLGNRCKPKEPVKGGRRKSGRKSSKPAKSGRGQQQGAASAPRPATHASAGSERQRQPQQKDPPAPPPAAAVVVAVAVAAAPIVVRADPASASAGVVV